MGNSTYRSPLQALLVFLCGMTSGVDLSGACCSDRYLGVAAQSGLVIGFSTPADAWVYCSARGTTCHSGWGRSVYLSHAQGIALRECAVRTPTYARCYIMYCS